MKSNREHAYPHERLVEELDTQQILHILRFDAWKTTNQSITSAETNNDDSDTPNSKNLAQGENACGVDSFADLTFDKSVKRVLDVGGGKFECCRDYMKQQNIDLLVWDPYNRSYQHNAQVQRDVMADKVDAATSMAVLNVIAEPQARLAHINTLKEALVVNGVAYFKIWPGEHALKGSYIPTVNSYGYPGYQANSYPDRFIREVQIVFGVENAAIDNVIPNLIVARKKTDAHTSEDEIRKIQVLAKKDTWQTTRSTSFQHLFFKTDSQPSLELNTSEALSSTHILHSTSK